MICQIPCCDCSKYSTCKEYYKKNRCRRCVYDKEDILTSICRKCRGFDLIHKNCKDYFEDKKNGI